MDFVTFGALDDDDALIVLGGGKIADVLIRNKVEGSIAKSGILIQSRSRRLLQHDLDKIQEPMKFAGPDKSSDAI